MKYIDVHIYIGKWGFPIKEMDHNEILDYMDKMGIEKAILMSALAINYDFINGNKKLYEEIENSNRLFGYVYINGNYIDESIDEMDRYLTNDKIVGVKFHPEYSGMAPNDERCGRFWDLLENKYNKPVLIHTWTLAEHNNSMPYSLPGYSLEIAIRHPKLKIILGHMGGPGWRECLGIAKKSKNIWVDYCCSFADRDKIKYAVDQIGSDKILFGSAMTENNGWTQIGALEEAEISNVDKYKIAYDNAAKLFGI